MSNDDYEVGYGKPPKHTQFTKSRSGNPKGRPKGSNNFGTDVKRALKAPVRLTEDGSPRTVSTQEAALLRLREKALKGDARALDRLLALAQVYNDEQLVRDASQQITVEDADILKAYNERLLRRVGKSQPDDHDGARDAAAQEADPAKVNEDATEEEEDDNAWLQ